MKRGPQNTLNQEGRNIRARAEGFVPDSGQHQYTDSQNQINMDLRNQQANVILSSFQVTIQRENAKAMSKLSAEDQETVNTILNSLKM